MIKVRTLGAAEIVIGRKRITPKTEVMFAVAVYLCVRAGERLSRDAVAEMFWPDVELRKARHNLRQMLYRLRLTGFVFADSSEVIRVDARVIETDLPDFFGTSPEELTKGSPPSDQPTFLASLAGDISPSFGLWLASMQERVTAHLREGALMRLAANTREGNWKHVVAWSDVILRSDPLNQQAHFAKAEASVRLGLTTAALSTLDQLSQDLEVKASAANPEIAALRKRIFEKRMDWGTRSASEAPLIGREHLMTRLSTLIESANEGRGGAIGLVGAGGVGKSRLAMEARSIAELRGFRCINLRADIAQSHSLALTLSLAAVLKDLPGASASPAMAYAIISRLTRHEDGFDPIRGNEHGDIPSTQVQWALGAVARSICTHSKLFIVIEDAHALDHESWESLSGLIRVAAGTHLVLVITGRTIPSSSTTRADLAHLVLPPLDSTASVLLAETLSEQSQLKPRGTSLATIAEISGGNPLFIRELLIHRSIHETDRLPPSLQQVITQRLSMLGADHTRLLRIVSLLGELCSIARLQEIAALTPSTVSSALDELAADGILSLTGTGTVLIHECWRSEVLARTSAVALASIGLECAHALADETQEHELLERLWLAADLFARAHEYPSARKQLATAGRLLLARGISQQATEAFSRALGLMPDADEAASLNERIAWSHNQAGHYAASISAAEAGLSVLRALGTPRPSLHLQLLSTLADSLWRDGRPSEEILADIEAGVQDPDVDDFVRQYSALVAMRLTYINASHARAAMLAEVVACANVRSGPSLAGELARLIHGSETGNPELVATATASIRELSRMPQPPLLLAKAIRYRSAALRFAGRIDEAEAGAREAIHKATTSGLADEALNARHALVFLYLDEGLLEPAREEFTLAGNDILADSSAASRSAHFHAEARLLTQSGQFRECLSLLAPRIDEIHADGTMRRQTANQACLAWSASACAAMDIARPAIDHVLAVVRSDAPCFQNDFAVEALIRALEIAGDAESARNAGREYLVRRATEFPQYIQRAYTRLRDLAKDIATTA